MPDEQGQGGPPQPGGDSKQFTYGVDERGSVILDGIEVERNSGNMGVAGSRGEAPPAPEDVEALRKERDELREKYEAVEHFTPILARPQFQEWIQEQAAMGEFEVPQAPPADPESVVAYHRRRSEPESGSIIAAMREWATTLPQHQAEELDNNHRSWNAAYDRFKAAGAGSLPRPAPAAYPQQVPMDRRSLEEIIKSKEVRNARVEGPGPALPQYEQSPDDAAKGYDRAKSRLARARSEGTPRERDEAETALVAAFFNNPKPRSGGY